MPIAVVAVLALSIICGCGGGGSNTGGSNTGGSNTGGGNSNPLTYGGLSVPVYWPARSRVTIPNAPLAAESVRVSVLRADGSVVTTQTMNRPVLAVGSADNETITLTALPLEALTVSLEAFSATEGSGASLGKATVPITLGRNNRSQSVSFAVESPIARLVINLPPGRVALTAGANGIPVGKVTTTAYDAADNAVPVLPEALAYSVKRPQAGFSSSLGSVGEDGTLYVGSAGIATVSVSELETQLAAEATLTVGTPVTLTMAISGTDTVIPVRPSSTDDSVPTPNNANKPLLVSLLLGTNPTTAQWTKGEVLNGTALTLTAPATYGDLQFAGWQSAAGASSAAPVLMIDPVANATAQFTAAYTSRAADDQGEFTPNYIHEVDGIDYSPPLPNEVVLWNLNDIRVAFVNADDFTPERRAAAIKSFDWWVQATGGRFHYTLLNDDDTDNANIIVAFTTNVISPRVQPATYNPGGSNQPPPRNGGITHFQTQSINGQQARGTGKRVILISNQDPTEIVGITAHEIFHAYGMAGHSNEKDDVMYPIYQRRNNFPSERDVNSLLTVLELSKRASVTRAQHGEPSIANGRITHHSIP